MSTDKERRGIEGEKRTKETNSSSLLGDKNEESVNVNMSMSIPLPYGGSLQEAIKHQDREAVKYLMRNREREGKESTHSSHSINSLTSSSSAAGGGGASSSSAMRDQDENNLIGNDENNERKMEGNESSETSSSSLQDCLLALGFSFIQIQDYFNSDSFEAESLKTILDSERHFPNPPRKFRKQLKINDEMTQFESDEHHVNPQMLRSLDPESTWTLLQCCVNNPTISQIQIFEILTQLASLHAVKLITPTACNWLRSILINGYITEVKCVLANLYLLIQSESTPKCSSIDKDNADQLLLSYMCPITREILVEPVTLQCGHNFTRTALEQSFGSGHRRCPICKAAVSSPISEFAVNVVLRDTIERLYPQVLLKRAVDDIQASQRAGIKELRSVIRWLHNFPQTPEVVHAVITAITHWVKDTSVDFVENRLKIIRDGHLPILCRIFGIIDSNSTSFLDLLLTLKLLALPYSIELNELSSSCRKLISTSMASILSADIHIDLMKILSHKTMSKSTSRNSEVECFDLLMTLLIGLEESEPQLKRFIQYSFVVPDPPLSSPSRNSSSEEYCSPISTPKTPPRNPRQSQQESPRNTPSRNEKKDKEDRLRLLLKLMIERIDYEEFVGKVLSVLIRLITLPSSTIDEQSTHTSLLISCGVIDAINTCFTYYSGFLDHFGYNCDARSAIYKAIIFVAKFSCWVNDTTRERLLLMSLPCCLRILRSWDQPHSLSIERKQINITCEVLFSTCEAFCSLLFGAPSSPSIKSGHLFDETVMKSRAWTSKIGFQTLSRILKVLEYRTRLHILDPCCLFKCPQMELVHAQEQIEFKSEPLFGLVRSSFDALPRNHSSLIRLTPVEVPEIRNPDDENDTTEISNPLLLTSLHDSTPMRIPSRHSLSLSISSGDVSIANPIHFVVMRTCDIDIFQQWILESPKGLVTSNLTIPNIPFVRVDLKTGSILRSSVSPVDTSKTRKIPSMELTEEFMPLSVLLSNNKHYRVDIAPNHLMINVNGIQSQTYMFPYTTNRNSNSIAHHISQTKNDEEKTPVEVEEEFTGGSLSSSFDDRDSAERFLSTVIAAVANERRLISQTLQLNRVLYHRLTQSDANIPLDQQLQEENDEQATTGEDLNLALWLMYPQGNLEEDVDNDNIKECELSPSSSLILLTSEIETLREDDLEILTDPSSEKGKFTHLPVIWDKYDDRYLRTGLGKGRLLFSNTQIVGVETVSEVTALSSTTNFGTHLYHFQILNHISSMIVGLSSCDGPPSQSLRDIPLTMLSLLYHSSGLIQLVVPTGSHPCVLMSEGNPPFEADDSIVIFLSHEEDGGIRIFHNNQLVYRLENLYQYIPRGTPLGAFVSLSKPGEELSVDHYVPNSTVKHDSCALSNEIDWRWLKDCFTAFCCSLDDEATCESLFEKHFSENKLVIKSTSLKTFDLSYGHDVALNSLSNFISVVTLSQIIRQYSSQVTIVVKCATMMNSLLKLQPEIIDLCPQFCTHDHSAPVARGAIAWSVRCPISYDHFISLMTLFSALGSFGSGKSGSLDSTHQLFLSIALNLVEGENPSFKPRDLMNIGVAHTLASFLLHQKEESTSMKILEFIRCCLNSETDLHTFPYSEFSGLAHVLMASGLPQRLSEVCCRFPMSSSSPEQKIVIQQTIVVVVEIPYRIHGGMPNKISDSWVFQELAEITSKPARNMENFFESLISVGKWHQVIAQQMEFPSNSAISLSSLLRNSFLEICHVESELPLTTICFDHRTQSSAHIWYSKGNDGSLPAQPLISAHSQDEMVEIIPDLEASSGNPSMLLLPDPKQFWMSNNGNNLPHWIDVRTSMRAAWRELQIQCQNDDSFHPDLIRIKVGSNPGNMAILREMNLSVTSSWQLILQKEEIKSFSQSNDLIIRVEILTNIRGTVSCLCGLRLVGLIPVSSGRVNDLSRLVFSDQRQLETISNSYKPTSWVEELYFDLLSGSEKNVESHLVGKEQNCHDNLFSGYGPWVIGHPGNVGNFGLIIPSTLDSAVSQMLSAGLSSLEIQNTISSASSRVGGGHPENVNVVDVPIPSPEVPQRPDRSERDPIATINDVATHLVARYGRVGAHLASLHPAPLNHHQSISSAVATIEAIRSLVRDEQIRLIQLSHGHDPDLDRPHSNIRIYRPPAATSGIRETSSSTTQRLVVSSGPVDFVYKKADGSIAIFDASSETCAPFGLLHSQTVRSHRHPDIGVGVVIGVHMNKIWIHLEKNNGATYRDDNWQYAELYVVPSEGQSNILTSVVKSSQVLAGRVIKINDRVRRGLNWQWHSQDVFAGNLGTVVEGAERDLWVTVEWDGGDRNTYRWGAEGCYDLEIVDGIASPPQTPVERDVSLRKEANNHQSGYLLNESLTIQERIRSCLWRGAFHSMYISSLYRQALRSNDVLLYQQSLKAMTLIAGYSVEAASSLNLTLRDLSEVMQQILSPQTAFQLCSAKFISTICSSGLIFSLIFEPVEQLSFPLDEIVYLMKTQGSCSILLLSSLRFLRDILWLCVNSPTMPTVALIQKKHQFRPLVADISHIFENTNEFVNQMNTFFHDLNVIENLVDLLLPMLQLNQSSSILLITLDLLSYLINYPNAIHILLSRNIDHYLVKFCKQLTRLQPSFSLKVIFHHAMGLMLAIESLVHESLPSLLSTILEFAESARDIDSILQTIQMHSNKPFVVCRCIEILIGGKKRYHNKIIPSKSWRNELAVGDKIDAKDKSQQWYEAIIKNINESKGEVFVHYIGWGVKYDEWIPILSDRIQILHSETGHWRDNLRLDDPVEILCIHNEGSDVKRRWFRGVVMKINEDADRLLIEYDKRGSHEERWVSLRYGEEICKVGTHVPSPAGSASELFKSTRKKQLLDSAALPSIYSILEQHVNSVEIARACLEGLEYIMSPQDGVPALSMNRQIDSFASQMAETLCRCIDIHSNKSPDLIFNGSIETPSEDIVESACHLICSMTACYSPDSNENTLNSYDEKFQCQISQTNSINFMTSFIAFGGHSSLIQLLLFYGRILDKQVLIPTLSTLSNLILTNEPWTSDLILLLGESGCLHLIVNLLSTLVETKSSVRLVTQCLRLLKYLCEASLPYKLTLFQLQVHATTIKCVTSFPNQPRVLAACLGLLACIISKDGEFQYPVCNSSSGEVDFKQYIRTNHSILHWKSEPRLPTPESPHWIEVSVLQGSNGWRELSLLLMDYGNSSPESMIFFYKSKPDEEFLEVKRISGLERSSDWCPLLSWEEVEEMYEQWQEDSSPTFSHEGTIRIEFIHNHNHGLATFLGGLRVLFPLPGTIEINSEERRKDAISALDGISMIVECLLQSKSSDRELYQNGRAFLQAFASNEQRAQFVVDCGGGYIL